MIMAQRVYFYFISLNGFIFLPIFYSLFTYKIVNYWLEVHSFFYTFVLKIFCLMLSIIIERRSSINDWQVQQRERGIQNFDRMTPLIMDNV